MNCFLPWIILNFGIGMFNEVVFAIDISFSNRNACLSFALSSRAEVSSKSRLSAFFGDVAVYVIVLPVLSRGEYIKLYVLWRGAEKLSEIILEGKEETWGPVAVGAYGEVYLLVDPFTLYKLGDNKKPRITNVSTEVDECNKKLLIHVEAYDNESALHRVILVYSINNSKWIYRDMEIARAYPIEPVGGYGYREEVYRVELDIEPSTSIEFYIIAIDNVGNYEFSRVYAYQVLKE